MSNPTNPTNTYTVPSVSITTARTGASSKANALGMRAMQERAYAKRGEQYLLIKSPPASGKSRALMFIALDKLNNQGLLQAIIVVPERSIGGSFADEPLSEFGFYWDWQVAPQWNLCNAPGVDEPRVAKSKVDAVAKFLESADKTLVCTHATFRFAVDELGVQAFDNRLIAIDEFHHVSSNPGNVLGGQLGAFIARDKVHLVAMTGSYFRGDSEAVLIPADEAKFEKVVYTYYEQLNGYQWLKSLDIGYFFYTGRYVEAVEKVLDPALKTIVHIPNVNARESLKDKDREVNEIMHSLGEWKGIDPVTGFHQIQIRDGRTLKVADLVDDSDLAQRSRVLTALKDPAQKNNRDHVDIIIALGMAKEGFDWIWCEHALTIGYRSSLTEIVQIIGRATRDAEGKERARFTNLIAEPAAEQAAVAEAVNDMLKAISASLLMEQVLAPRYEFTPKNNGPKEGFDYGEDGYKEGGHNIGVNKDTGQIHLEINGLITPQSPEAQTLLAELDTPGLLSGAVAATMNVDELDEDALLIELGVTASPANQDDIMVLRHVRSTAEMRAAEKIADRTPCADFDKFQPLFEQVERELKAGVRITLRFGRDASIASGNTFIVGGQLAYVAEVGETIKAPNGESDARLRVIYANGTESNLLRRSLQRALYKDETGRRLTDTDMGPLFGDAPESDDIETGTIYVLRSLSSHPFVAEHRELIHKIGVTGGKMETRIAGAEKDATYLLADVEVVATYKLHNLNRTKLENLFHRLFGAAQLDLTLSDRFGNPVKPREWFLVPLHVIDEAVQRIRDGSITEVVYDPKTARLMHKY